MCDFPAEKEIFLSEPMRAWKVVVRRNRPPYEGLYKTGPYFGVPVRERRWMRVLEKRWMRSMKFLVCEETMVGWRCFFSKSDCAEYLKSLVGFSDTLCCVPVTIKGRCRITEVDIDLFIPPYCRGINAEYIKFEALK